MMARQSETGGFRRFDKDCGVQDTIEVCALSEDDSYDVHSNISTDDSMAIYTDHLHKPSTNIDNSRIVGNLKREKRS